MTQLSRFLTFQLIKLFELQIILKSNINLNNYKYILIIINKCRYGKKNMNNNMSLSFTKSFGTQFLFGHFSRNLHFDRHFNIISFFES